MNLNLGCGTDYIDGWINIDTRTDVKADIHCSIQEIEKHVEPETADQIQATNILEHISWKEIDKVLKGLYNLLRINGKLFIRGPDINRAAEKFITKKIDEQEFIKVVYGDQDYLENTHKSGWSEEGLKEKLKDAGFKDIEVTWRDESWGFEIGGKR